MRFGIFYSIGYFHVILSDYIKNLSEMLITMSSLFSSLLMKIIDSERMQHAESTVEQSDEISELFVLKTINEIKDEANDLGSWNDDHEGRLNYFGNILANEYDWEVDEVHRYLMDVIAQGPSQDDD